MKRKVWLTNEVLNEVLAGKRMSEKSSANYRMVFRSLSKSYSEFPTTPVEINKWLVGLTGYSDATVALFYTILHGAYEYMEVSYGLKNACKGVERPRVRKQRRRYHKAADILRILQSCRSEYETALIMTLVDSGCRVGGLAGLTGDKVGEGYIDVVEKGGNERRYRLDMRVCEVLKRLAGDGKSPIFRLSAAALSVRILRICRRAGLTGRKLGAHTFRHSAGTLVAKETGSALAVKAMLQHDSIQSSMIYIHDIEDDIQKRISPLRLVSEQVGITKQLPMKGTPEVVEEPDIELDSLVGDMFPAIPANIEVRSVLRSEDLEVIRKGFVELARNGQYVVEVGKARELLRRMLRKVGGKLA